MPTVLFWHGAKGGGLVVAAAATAETVTGDNHVTLIVGLAAAFAALVTPVVVAVIQRRPSGPGADPLSTQMMRTILDDLEAERAARHALEAEKAALELALAATDRRSHRRPRPGP